MEILKESVYNCESSIVIVGSRDMVFRDSNFREMFGRVDQLVRQDANVGEVAFIKDNRRYIYVLIVSERWFQKPSLKTILASVSYLRNLIVKHQVDDLIFYQTDHWRFVQNEIVNQFRDMEIYLGVACSKPITRRITI